MPPEKHLRRSTSNKTITPTMLNHTESSLLETLCQARHRTTAPIGVHGYDIARQQQIYTVSGDLLPQEVQASDGSADLKVTDKGVD